MNTAEREPPGNNQGDVQTRTTSTSATLCGCSPPDEQLSPRCRLDPVAGLPARRHGNYGYSGSVDAERGGDGGSWAGELLAAYQRNCDGNNGRDAGGGNLLLLSGFLWRMRAATGTRSTVSLASAAVSGVRQQQRRRSIGRSPAASPATPSNYAIIRSNSSVFQYDASLSFATVVGTGTTTFTDMGSKRMLLELAAGGHHA